MRPEMSEIDRLAGGLFLQRHGDVGIGGQADPVALDAGDEAERRLGVLFDTFDIPRGDYMQLAVALASRHIIGFRPVRRRVRSGTRKRTIGVATGRLRRTAVEWAAEIGVPAAKRPGRPRVNDAEAIDKALVREADEWHQQQRAKGVRKPSDAAYLRELCARAAKRAGSSTHRFTRKLHGGLSSRLSRARRRLSKPIPK